MSKKDRVPAAVNAAAARAEDLHKQIYSTPEPAQPDPNAPVDPAPQDAASTVPPAAPVEPQAPAPTPPAEDESWQHKYNSMKGRFDRARDQIAQMSEQLTNMQALIATMQSAPQPPAQPTPAELSAASMLTPEERELYGQDFLDVVAKQARGTVSSEVQSLRNQVQELNQRIASLGGQVVADARQKMFSSMDEKCPNWRELNDDPKFLAWLGLPDPYSGAIRHDLLKAAYEQNATPRVLAFFQGFLAEEAATAPANAEPDPTPGAVAAKIPLDALAAPGRAKTAATPPAEKPFISRAQISQFYVDKSAGKYRGREEEAAKLEREIFDAQREGRIR